MAKDTKASTSKSDEDGRKYRAPALEKGLDVLELLAQSGAPMTTSHIASTMGRSVSELFRMVLTLEYRGYIAQADGGEGYKLTNKLFTLGMAETRNRSLLDAALPVMSELSRTVGQSCHMVVASGDQMVVVARIESPRDLGFAVRIGYRRPIVASASGLVLYGYQPEAEKANWLPQLAASTDEEGLERFLERSQEAVANGFVRSPSRFVDGITDLCVPIMGSRGPIAALIVPFILFEPLPATAEEVIDQLHDAARRISSQLSGE